MVEGVIRGYALPYGSPIVIDGAVETCAANAVAIMASGNVQLQWGVHGGDVLARVYGSLRLFNDDFGLGFEARIDERRSSFAAYCAIASGEVAWCSVNFSEFIDQNVATRDGVSHRTIKRATIDHISLVACNAAYPDTVVWAPESYADPFDMPPRIRAAAGRWATGWRQDIAARERRSKKARASSAAQPALAPDVLSSVPPVPATARADGSSLPIERILASARRVRAMGDDLMDFRRWWAGREAPHALGAAGLR